MKLHVIAKLLWALALLLTTALVGSIVIHKSASAQVTTTVSDNFINSDIQNKKTTWLKVSNQNVGVGIVVLSGTCKVEITTSDFNKCADGTAIEFPWDPSSVTLAPGRHFRSFSGISCVRADCTSGTAKLVIRK